MLDYENIFPRYLLQRKLFDKNRAKILLTYFSLDIHLIYLLQQKSQPSTNSCVYMSTRKVNLNNAAAFCIYKSNIILYKANSDFTIWNKLHIKRASQFHSRLFQSPVLYFSYYVSDSIFPAQYRRSPTWGFARRALISRGLTSRN